MMTRRMNPLATFNDLHREVDRLFDAFRPGGGLARGTLFPALNVWDQGDAWMVEAEIPGVKRDDLEILAVDDQLTIKGNRQPQQGKDLAWHRRERGAGEFTRVVSLPSEVDADRIEATLVDGVLTLKLPKAARAKPRKITVQTN